MNIFFFCPLLLWYLCNDRELFHFALCSMTLSVKLFLKTLKIEWIRSSVTETIHASTDEDISSLRDCPRGCSSGLTGWYSYYSRFHNLLLHEFGWTTSPISCERAIGIWMSIVFLEVCDTGRIIYYLLPQSTHGMGVGETTRGEQVVWLNE